MSPRSCHSFNKRYESDFGAAKIALTCACDRLEVLLRRSGAGDLAANSKSVLLISSSIALTLFDDKRLTRNGARLCICLSGKPISAAPSNMLIVTRRYRNVQGVLVLKSDSALFTLSKSEGRKSKAACAFFTRDSFVMDAATHASDSSASNCAKQIPTMRTLA